MAADYIDFISSYCDRWCERCAFTSHCRLFSLQAEMAASSDSNFAPAHAWLEAQERDGKREAGRYDVIGWFHFLIAAKTERALGRGLARACGAWRPNLRAFVRPGLDEPEAVARLDRSSTAD